MNESIRTIAAALLVLTLTACSESGQRGDLAAMADIAQAAARQSDRIEVEQLASWLIEERQDFTLIDVRTESDFAQGHIGAARHVPIAELFTLDGLDGLPADRTIVLYSNGSENGAKAAVLLRLAGFDTQLLVGGYNAWQQRILNPDIPAEEMDGESLQVSAQRAFACYFVGERSGAAAQRPDVGTVQFVPPVVEADEDLEPLPPTSEEGC